MNAARAILGVLLGDLRRSPGAALGAVAAMAAGVSVFVAIHLAGSAAQSSFVSAVEAVAGRATHEVEAPGGVPEERFAELAVISGVEAAQPLIEGRAVLQAVVRNGQSSEAHAPPLRVLGIDPFFVGRFLNDGGRAPLVPGDAIARFLTEPGVVVLPKAWADAAGAREGDTLVVAAAGRPCKLRVMSVYEVDALGEATRDTAVADLASAQELFDMTGRLTRVDLIVKEGREDTVRAALAPGERLDRPAQRGDRVAKMIEAFRLNLLALGMLAMVVGALLIYNAAQFSVVRRAGLLGQLRCMGVTRPMLLGAVLGEVVLFGIVGGLLGLVGGVALAQELVKPIAQTVTDLYHFVRVDVAALEPLECALIVLAAAAVAGAAGFFPALDAARTQPRMVGLRSHGESAFKSRLPRLTLLGLAWIALAFAASAAPFEGRWPGFVASFALLGTGAALMPAAMALLLPILQRQSERRGMLSLALSSGALYRSLTRTGGAAAALGVALAMTVGVIVMVHSFEREVHNWIQTAIRADIFIGDAYEYTSRENARVPAEAVEIARKAPGVRAIDTLRAVEVPYGGRSIRFTGVELPTDESRARFEFLEGRASEALDAALAGGAIISEPLANHHGLKVGDMLEVPGRGAGGLVRFKISGIIRDFTYDRGYALTGKDAFVAAFGDPGVTNVAAYVTPGEDREQVAESLRKAFEGRFLLNVRSNAELRAGIIDVFERTFAVTYLLQVIATVMALCGAAITLFGLFLERAREIATLRALGATVAGIGRLFAAESLLMAFFPILLALPLGALLAWVLIHVVNLRSFGWSIGYDWPWGQVLATCALAAGASLLATLVPLALAKRQSISAALREE